MNFECTFCGQQINTQRLQGWIRPYHNHPRLPDNIMRPSAGEFEIVYCCDTEFCNARAARIPKDAFLTQPLDPESFLFYDAMPNFQAIRAGVEITLKASRQLREDLSR